MFEKLKKRMRRKSRKFVKESTSHLYDKVRMLASLTDHSLKDLRYLDHPYSKANPTTLHPMNMVHKQSGTLYENIKMEITSTASRDIGRVYVDIEKVPYLPYVIHGTSYMKSRDFLKTALFRSTTEIEKELKKIEKEKV